MADTSGWGLVVIEEDFDTSSATGRLMAHIVTGIAQWERETIAERTKDALAEKKRRLPRGAKLGRPAGPG